MRPAFSLIELLIAVSIVGVITVMSLPPWVAMRDKVAVDGAAASLARALADARSSSLMRSERHAVRADTSAASVAIHVRADTLLRLPLGTLFGVRIGATRDSIAWAATGIGYGAANATFVVTRGASAETVTVSRAGRVQR
ncbi:MAG: type II secretion system protein [Gemmatimonadota bacterium]